MKNKFLWSSLFFTSLLSTGVFAQEGPMENVFRFLYDFFGWIPAQLSKLLGGGAGAETIFYAKFILWVLMFSILYWVSNKFIFKGANKGVQITVPFVISIMGVVLIPNNIITEIFATYTLVTVVLIWTIPVMGLLFLNHSIKQKFGTTPQGYIIRFFAFVVGAMVTARMTKLLPTIMDKIDQYVSYMGLISGLMGLGAVLALIGLIRSLGWGGGTPGAYAGGGGFGGWMKHSWDSFGRSSGRSGGLGGIGSGEERRFEAAEEPLVRQEEHETRDAARAEHKEEVDLSHMEGLTKRSMRENKKIIADLRKIEETFRVHGLDGLHNEEIRRKLAEVYKYDTKEAEQLQKMQVLTAKIDEKIRGEFGYLEKQEKQMKEIVARAQQLGRQDFNPKSFQMKLQVHYNTLRGEFEEIRKEIGPIEAEIRKTEVDFRAAMTRAVQSATTVDQDLVHAIQAKTRQEELLETLKKSERRLEKLDAHESHILLKEVLEEKEIKKVVDRVGYKPKRIKTPKR
jgi:hypothetical protein